ncbi:MAG: hypothetical protein V1837_05190 [Candidatus Woesearchaeota archaeon]
MVKGLILGYSFLVALVLIYIICPLAIAFYLYKHKFMSDRIRYLFAALLCFNVLFLVFLVVLDFLSG